jgi:4-amino-4-deoxy-L-arabinose transferase-like glycosyltransferase
MVRHLLETGAYQLHDWAAANLPFQTYWGALFAKVLGYSFASLKISTLVMLLGGLIGVYSLALEHGLSKQNAGLLGLVLLANPLTLVLSFSFMTDVPFLACVILALAFYTRAIRLPSKSMMLLGSVCASAAILVRSFGAAFLPGLVLVWLFSRRKRETVLMFALGLILPIFASGWQVIANTGAPNWAVPLHLQWQLAYVTNLNTLPPEMLWRLTIVLQYLAFFSLPLLPVALAEYWHSLVDAVSTGHFTRALGREVALALGLVIWLVGTTVLGTFVLKRLWIMPILPWNFQDLESWPEGFGVALTLITLSGAFLFGRIFLLRYLPGGKWHQAADHERLLDWVTLFLLLLQITFFQFGDEYLLHLLPFALIVVGLHVSSWMDQLRWPTVGRAVALLVVGALWVRGAQSEAQATWTAEDSLVAKGVQPEQVHATWEWASYYGAFDNYLRAFGRNPPDAREGYFGQWLPQLANSADYQVKRKTLNGNQWTLIVTIAYRDMFFAEQMVYIYKRVR